MDILSIIIISIGLAMDCFAVSISKGICLKKFKIKKALRMAVLFGGFQALMPLIGYLGGKGLLGFVSEYTNFIAFGLLALIGLKMIYEGMHEGIEEEFQKITNKVMLTLAIATSIDAMAAGFSLTLLPINPFLACFIIGMITFIMSFIGVFVGKISGTWLESKAEILGGMVLVIIGFRLLFF